MKCKINWKKKVVAGLAVFGLCGTMIAKSPQQPRTNTPLSEDQKILHVLNRLGFGPRGNDIEKVRRMGLDEYIERQLNPDSITDDEVAAALRRFDISGMSTAELFAKYPNPGALLRKLQNNPAVSAANPPSSADREMERRQRRRKLADLYRQYGFRPANQIMTQVQASRIIRATYSHRQLEEVMVDFWANHFSVYSGKAATRWYIPSYERDVIRKHALGNFRDLVEETARHPAMLFYLDNFQSVSPDAGMDRGQEALQRFIRNGKLDPRVRQRLKRRGLSDEQVERQVQAILMGGNSMRGINENYARELMELHTLGVDGGFTAEDINSVARAFTGWTIFDPLGYRRAAANLVQERDDMQIIRQARRLGISPDTESGAFIFVERLHDKSSKTVMGQLVDEGGIKDGQKVIDILVRHPATAKFIARKLAVKFVNDEPPADLVNEVAAAFTKSDGDIKSTLRALFKSKDFFSRDNYRAKIKTPFELMVSSLRTLDADIKGPRALVGLLNKMGEPLYGYQAPTGYPDTAADWVNTGALLERMNFAVALVSNSIPQTTVNLGRFDMGDKRATVNRTIEIILHGEISATTKTALIRQLEMPPPDLEAATDKNPFQVDTAADLKIQGAVGQQPVRIVAPRGNPEVFSVVGLILGSPEFQRQ